MVEAVTPLGTSSTMADQPGEHDIKQIFKRLLSVPTNKQCFDCGHSHPTWATITYGVFLCIDCSAVHRSLGVHVTFIRSTQLDTNWTWLQLRAMQVGGNANARSFFNQHGASTTDAQKKYHSRAAQMYRDKVLSLAQHAMRLHGSKLFIDEKVKATNPSAADKLHIDSADPTSPEAKEVDFFSEHAEDKFPQVTPIEDNARLGGATTNTAASAPKAVNGKAAAEVDSSAGPNVEAALSTSPSQVVAEPRKALIGNKKAPAARKGKGLGAQRVKKDFGEIESRAQQVDKEKEELAKNIAIQEAKTKEEQEKQMANMRLAYQDMSLQRKKEEEKLMRNDPKKAEQFERLGMGFAGHKGISHSAMTDMHTIQQENPKSGSSGAREFDSYGEKPRGRRDFFDDEFEFVSSSSSSSWGNKRGGGDYGSKNDDFGSSGWGSKNKSGGWDFDKFDDTKSTPIDSFGSSSSRDMDNSAGLDKGDGDGNENASNDSENDVESSRSRSSNLSSPSEDSGMVQKKFGSAKGISSDQLFGNRDNDFETKQNLSRLQGSTAISSDDYFGRSSNRKPPSYNANAPDFQDIKDGVKQGVTKVAGKLSNIANGVMSSLQDRYG